jgi:hypothetical protein
MKFAAFISIIVSLAVMIGACQGAVGKAGEDAVAVTGPSGPTGPPGQDAKQNQPPALKADTKLGTQQLALASRVSNEPGIKKVSVIPVSTYFEDPEGVVRLTYSVAELSADDKKVVSVYLTDEAGKPAIADDNDMFTGDNAMPTHMKDGVTGTAFLAIEALTAGTVTLDLTVNDGLPGGKSTHQIPVMVRAANAQPVPVATVLTDAAFTAMSRITVNRIPSTGAVTVSVPDGAFEDADNDDIIVTAAVGGRDAETIAANKLLLDVSIDANDDLLLTPKKGGPATGTIPVILTATDPFGTSVMTGDTGAQSIQVKVNTAPMHMLYESGGNIPTGKKVGDPVELSDIADKDLSVSAEGTNGDPDFIVLATYFEDPDTEDNLAGANGICSFATDQPTGTAAYATVAFNVGRDEIGVTPLKPGSFVLSVTCTDGKMESLTDQVTVTIRQ